MRSLAPKLLLAFLAVSLTVALLAAAITRFTTQQDFEELVLSNAQNNFIDRATTYYEVTGSWQGFAASIIRRQNQQGDLPGQLLQPQQPPRQPAGDLQNPPAGQPPIQPEQLPPQHQSTQQDDLGNTVGTQPLTFALIDSNGRVVVPAGEYRRGDVITVENFVAGTVIEIDGETVGTVIATGNIPPMAQREELFLTRTNQSLLYATLGAMAIALVISLVLTRGLTRPLRELTTAIRHTAKGEFGRQVAVHSKDEIGQLARDFNQMSADLAHLNEQRRQMTADIAHDLRTPLTVIAGYIESMRDGVLKPTPERLETMHNEVHHLQRLVEDLRTLSLAEAGELSLNRAPIAPIGLLEQVQSAYQHAAERKGVSLTIQAAPDLPRINVDPDRMMQVLGNLVSNALRYTSKGGKIAVSGQPSAVGGLRSVKFSVADTGSGINPTDISRIFDRFYRVDDARNGEGGETGLGLAIAKSIVEMHGGEISVESELGRGTSFTVSLPR
ncbi:MAG: HAMP domain-containing protein [Anaerolineales bacterium]|nr:HAMP domain-containing protein [Chloroflexota bacterium]MBL6983402.1 HAMP domain-containing protein [Anaerolineales bacterium]